MPRLQVNLSFTPEAYEVVKAAAEAEGLSIVQFARTAIMDAAEPMPEGQDAESASLFAAWWLATMALIRRGNANPG